MEFQEIVEIVQVKSKQALDSHLVGNSTAAVEALQEVATIINSEFGATDEVAAASPEGDEPPESAEIVALPAKYVQIHEHIREAEIAFAAGIAERGIEDLGLAAELIKEILSTETR